MPICKRKNVILFIFHKNSTDIIYDSWLMTQKEESKLIHEKWGEYFYRKIHVLSGIWSPNQAIFVQEVPICSVEMSRSKTRLYRY